MIGTGKAQACFGKVAFGQRQGGEIAQATALAHRLSRHDSDRDAGVLQSGLLSSGPVKACYDGGTYIESTNDPGRSAFFGVTGRDGEIFPESCTPAAGLSRVPVPASIRPSRVSSSRSERLTRHGCSRCRRGGGRGLPRSQIRHPGKASALTDKPPGFPERGHDVHLLVVLLVFAVRHQLPEQPGLVRKRCIASQEGHGGSGVTGVLQR